MKVKSKGVVSATAQLMLACGVCTAPGDFGPLTEEQPDSGVCSKCVDAGLQRFRFNQRIRLTPESWISSMHRSAVVKDPDQAMRITDAHHLVLDQVTAEIAADRNGATEADAFADRLLSTAIFYMGESIKAAPDPAAALRALRAALSMTTLEG